MTILDLIKKSALMLNVEQILNDKSLAEPTVDQLDNILTKNTTLAKMYEFAKLTINEVCSHNEAVYEIKCNSKNKYIQLRIIPDIVKVVAVKDNYGCVKFSIINEAIKVQEDGEYTVLYCRNPEIKNVLSELDTHSGTIGEDIFLFGLNSYYCLANGLYAEYNVYNNQYIERLSQMKNLKLFNMPCRSWHG